MNRVFTILAAFAILLATSCHKNEIPTGKPVVDPVEKPEEKPENDKTSISILAIGNSFSVDAMHYLYGFLKEAGYKEVHLGNLYIGSCSLKTHAGHFTSNDKSYTYYTNDSGSWATKNSHSPIDALTSREWDYISMQQASADSGMPDTYDPYLGQLIDIVSKNCPKAKLLWHMTWAYQANSSHASFPKYDNDQTKMYQSIVSAVKAKIVPVKAFDKIIPSGTAVQNLRTSFIGDNITRDGHHMSYNIGRYVTALMWARQIVGLDVEKSSYLPADQALNDSEVKAMKDAVEKAFKKPFEVTESSFKESPNKDDEPKTLDEMMKSKGYDLSKYERMSIALTTSAYYNSSNASYKSTLISKANSTASNLDQYAATPIYGKEDLPTGTIIVVMPGYQYRPEGWTALDTANKSADRPATVSATITEVTSAWWGSWNYRAFNIAKTGNPALSASEQAELKDKFGIYKPKAVAGQ